MFNISKNGIITIHRGDTFTIPLKINLGTSIYPDYYTLQKHDEENQDYLYVALLQPGEKWEEAILKICYTSDSPSKHFVNDLTSFEYDAPLVHFYTEYTEHLKPGNYYYEVKLQRCSKSTSDGFESIDTIIPKTKFVILE